jgi:hypothetical protein
MRNATLAALLLLAACSASAPPAAPAPAALKPVDAKALLADDAKVSAYFAYWKEMAPLMKTVMGAATGSYDAGAKDGDKMGKALAKDDRMKTYAAADAAARARNGITQEEINALAGALTEYATTRHLFVDATKADKGGMLAKVSREHYQKAKEKFVAAYGQPALDLVTKHEAELLDAQAAVMAGVMGKP